jgi:secreted trypsin-like serine protease
MLTSTWIDVTGLGCGDPERPGIYTRVSKFKNWIVQKAGKTLLDYEDFSLSMSKKSPYIFEFTL